MVYNRNEGTLRAPVLLLQDKQLTYLDKHVWLLMWLDKKDKSITDLASPTRLAERAGCSRPNIYPCLARLAAAGWYQAPQPVLAPRSRLADWVDIRADLLTCRELTAEDLSLKTIREKLQGLAPLRDLRGLEPIARYLDERGRRYRISTQQYQAQQASA